MARHTPTSGARVRTAAARRVAIHAPMRGERARTVLPPLPSLSHRALTPRRRARQVLLSPGGITDDFSQPRLDIHMNIFKRARKIKCAGINFRFDLV